MSLVGEGGGTIITESAIWHGDSRVLGATITQPIHMILTDPPYGVAHLSGFAQTADGKRFVREIEGDADVDRALALFSEVMAPLVAASAEQCEMYVFCRWSMIGAWSDAISKLVPFEVKNVLIWDKGWPGLGDLEANWAYTWEAIIYAKKGRRPIKNRRSSIISVDRTLHAQMIHPTQKPVALLETLIEMSTNRGDLIVDPFSGSGSTVVAASNLGRIGLGIELDEFYIARSRQRLQQGIFDI